MSLHPKALRRHYGKILTAIFILFLIGFSISQWTEKATYKDYISNRLKKDFHGLETIIQNNNELYGEILNEGSITENEVFYLINANQRIAEIIWKYRDLAASLHFRDEQYRYDHSTVNALNLAQVFYEWKDSFESELDEESKLRIVKARELTSKWDSAIERKDEVYERYSLSNSAWLELLENIEKNTLDFLNENNVETIQDLWLTRK